MITRLNFWGYRNARQDLWPIAWDPLYYIYQRHFCDRVSTVELFLEYHISAREGKSGVMATSQAAVPPVPQLLNLQRPRIYGNHE
jgi:hypothetical protein